MASPDERSATDAGSVEQALQPLVEELPPAAVRKILSHVCVDSMPGQTEGQAQRLDAVRSYLIGELNRRRPNRVQRLFMSLFEPVLVTDPVLLRAAGPVYGVFQRGDIAALFTHLREVALSPQVNEAEQFLTAQIQKTLIDDILRMEETASYLEKLRSAAVGYLADVVRNPAKLGKLVAAVNGIRGRAAAAQGGGSAQLAPFDRQNVVQVQVFLKHADLLCATASKVLDAWDAEVKRTAQPEAAAETVADMLAATRGDLERTAGSARAAALIPLVLVHQRQAHGIVPAYLARMTVSPEERTALATAVLGHLTGAARTFEDDFSRTLALAQRRATRDDASALPLPVVAHDDRAALEGLLDRVVRTAAVLRGLTGVAEVRQALAGHWAQLRQLFADLSDGVVLPRLEAQLARCAETPADHATVLWVCRLIGSWYRTMAETGETRQALEVWLEQLQTAVLEGLRGLLVRDDRVPAVAAMRFLVRLDDLLGTVDGCLLEHLSMASEVLPALLEQRLRAGEPLTPAETRLLKGVVAMARDEVKASRYWKPRVASRLVETADAAGLLEAQ